MYSLSTNFMQVWEQKEMTLFFPVRCMCNYCQLSRSDNPFVVNYNPIWHPIKTALKIGLWGGIAGGAISFGVWALWSILK